MTTQPTEPRIGERYRRNGPPGRSPCIVEKYSDGAWHVVEDYGSNYTLAHWHVSAANTHDRFVQLQADHATLTAALQQAQARNATLEAELDEARKWAALAIEVIDLGVDLMPLEQFRQWTSVGTAQHVYYGMVLKAQEEAQRRKRGEVGDGA
jgi:hypothetical protein